VRGKKRGRERDREMQKCERYLAMETVKMGADGKHGKVERRRKG